ncbi:trehalose-phosphatase [Nordella sp. HKS 07]|uniref:trehalose-phosphatase n=1 Tax=Nordella sp. HKS 07 TaxID=2712222 RepID=UPI0013E0F09B|nr:trehalose-phosphatase [Nordella sp. HKS 07]QIG49611.1 trehalose-phosphatase [Nordella sp. HKS 07]
MVTQSPADQPSQTLLKPPRLTLRHALFLDLDGTLIDIAERPSAIVVPRDLPALLMRLQIFLGGAVAIVSGRPLGDLLVYLAPADLDIIAEHGAVVKRRGKPAPAPEAIWPESWQSRLQSFLDDHPAAEIEYKTSSIALHFRREPDAADAASRLLKDLVSEAPAGAEILPAKMAFELKLSPVNKGQAIIDLMKVEPYRRRIPVFAGDDVTDEPGFAAVRAMNGVALPVDRAFGGEPRLVRAWLAREIGIKGEAAA